jgi:hypothetical protein
MMMGYLLHISSDGFSRKLIGGEAVIRGVDMALIMDSSALYFYSIGLFNSLRRTLGRDEASAAQTSAMSAGINNVINNTVTTRDHTYTYTYTFSTTLRVLHGFIFAFITFLHTVYD